MSRRSASKNGSKSVQQDDAYLQAALDGPESAARQSAAAQWPKTLMKRFVVEQTMSQTAVLAVQFGFWLVQVVPTLVKEMLHTDGAHEWRAAVRVARQHHGWVMLALAVVLLFKMIYDRLFLMGFVKISLRTELFKLSIYLSLVFTYIVYPLMIILLGVSIGDWTAKAQDSAQETPTELAYLAVPIAWAFALAVGGLNVWGEFVSRNTCPSRSLLGAVRRRAELLSYTAWNLSLLLSAFVLCSGNTRSRAGSVIELVMTVFVFAGSFTYLHSVVQWNQTMAVFSMSWAAVAFALKATSSLVDFYLLFEDSPGPKDPFFLLAILVAPVFYKLGGTLTARLYRINVWDTTLNLTTRCTGILLMLDAVAAPHHHEPELRLYYRGVFESNPASTEQSLKGSHTQLKVGDTPGKKGLVNLFQAPDEKNLKQNDASSSQAPIKGNKTEQSSWYLRGFSKSRSKTMAKQDFRLAKSYDIGFDDKNSAEIGFFGNKSKYTVPLNSENMSSIVCDVLIEYAKTSLDQSDERVWQLLLLLHMHRGFPSLVLLSRLLQRLEARAMKRGISAQLEYHNFRKLYETKLDALYKGTVAEGEQPTMHSVWDIYCTLNLEETVGEWDGGTASSKKNRFTGESDEQIELAKVPKIQRIAGLGQESNLAEPNWPFDQLKYYNMVVSKVLKLTDTRRALFSNLQGDKIVRSSFVYSCNRQSIKFHSQVKKDFQIFAANPPQFASYVYPMFIYYFSLIRNSPRLSKSILSAYKTKLLKVASQTSRKSKFDDVDWIQSSCVALQLSLDLKDLGSILGASLNYAEHLGEPHTDDDPVDNWIVGRTLDSLLPAEFRLKHKQVVQQTQDLEQLRVHERGFFLMGFDDRLRSTQGLIKVLPCLSKRITAVSLLNFQYNPGSSLVLVEKDMSILHAEKKFWDVLQDQPVDSLEELSPEIRAAVKLYSFVLGKHRAAADHSQPTGLLPKIEQLFRGFGPGLLGSEHGQALSAWCSQLYFAVQEFWKFNEAKGLAFGIPTDNPYWGVFEDDQIVGGFEWNPASTVCGDVYKVYLRLVRVHNKGHQQRQSPPKAERSPGTLPAVDSDRLAAPVDGQNLLLKFNSQQTTMSQFSRSQDKIHDRDRPPVPGKQGENLLKEHVLRDQPTHRAGIPPTPFPHRPVHSESHDSLDDSMMQPPVTTGRVGFAAMLGDPVLPTTARSVLVSAPRQGPPTVLAQVAEETADSTPGDSSDGTRQSNSRLSLAARARLEERAADRDSGRETLFATILRDLFDVLDQIDPPGATRLAVLDSCMDSDLHLAKPHIAAVQADLGEWVLAIRELRLSLPAEVAARPYSSVEVLPVSPMADSRPFTFSVPRQPRGPGTLVSHQASTTTAVGADVNNHTSARLAPLLPSQTVTDKPELQQFIKTVRVKGKGGRQTVQDMGHFPQTSRRHAKSNFIGNILNKVMVGKI